MIIIPNFIEKLIDSLLQTKLFKVFCPSHIKANQFIHCHSKNKVQLK